MSTSVKLNDGTILDLSGRGLQHSKPSASFELVLCRRDDLTGEKIEGRRSVYRGNNPAAVEATFLGHLTEEEKKKDVYAV